MRAKRSFLVTAFFLSDSFCLLAASKDVAPLKGFQTQLQWQKLHGFFKGRLSVSCCPETVLFFPISVNLVIIILQRYEKSVFFQTLPILKMIININPQARNFFFKSRQQNTGGSSGFLNLNH